MKSSTLDVWLGSEHASVDLNLVEAEELLQRKVGKFCIVLWSVIFVETYSFLRRTGNFQSVHETSLRGYKT